MARYTTTGTFDLNPFCMAGATATGSLDRSNTAISVRGLKCSNGITSYQAFASKLILLGGPDGLFQAASRQVLEDYVLTMSRYYLGSEQNVITGQVTPVKVPVCNLADGEGKLNDANGHLDRSYTVASNWIKDLDGGSKQFKDYWSCGTPCLFKKVDDVYFPARREARCRRAESEQLPAGVCLFPSYMCSGDIPGKSSMTFSEMGKWPLPSMSQVSRLAARWQATSKG